MPSLKRDLDALIEAHGFAHVRDQIMARTKSSIRLVSTTGPTTNNESRLGGNDALLPVPIWPQSQERPLQLLAQINLAELPPSCSEVPTAGHLAFFYDAEAMPDYTDGDHTGWSVLYTPASSAAHRVASPVPAFSAKSLRLVEDLTIPTIRSIDMMEMDLTDEDRQRYWDLLEAAVKLADPDGKTIHRMMGHPDGIQGCMQRTLQFKTRGLSLTEGVYSWYEHPRAGELMPGAHDWRLLLQVDSDPDQFGTYWGDCGRLFFWIHRDDLEKRLFKRVWLVFQGH